MPAPISPKSVQTDLDAAQCIKMALDTTSTPNPALKVEVIGVASGSRTCLDIEQAIKRAFDQSTGKIRIVEA